MYRKRATGWARYWDFILLDILCLEISFVLAYLIRHGWENPFGTEIYRTLAFVMALLDFAVAAVFNTFSRLRRRSRYQLFLDTFKHVGLVLLLDVFFTFVMQTSIDYSRTTIFITAVLHLFLGWAVKLAYRELRRANKSAGKALFLIATSGRAADMIRCVQDELGSLISITGAAIVDRDMVGETIEKIAVVANKDTVLDYLVHEWVDEVFFCVPRESALSESLFSSLLEMGLIVHVDVGHLNVYSEQKQVIEKVGKSVVITTAINMISEEKLILKRALDLVGGLIGSLLALLIMLAVAIPIKLKSPGPLLYASERIGQNGKRFKMYKIRSMYLDADERKAGLMSQNRIKDGMMFKLDWDPRIIGNETRPDGTHKTGIGEFIRRTSLDEFPQFFNVVLGDMSLVGTRPPTADEFRRYSYHHRARLSTKPGITGMWQVNGRSEITDFEEVVRLDMEYIANWSMALDFKILFKTIAVLFTGKGAM